MKNQQHNLESKAREALKNREIKPSSQAWDRIDAMLTQTEMQQPKSNNNWMYIAASILLLGFLSLFFFNSEDEKSTIEVVNKTEDFREEKDSESVNIINNQNIQNDLNAYELAHSSDKNMPSKQPIESIINKKSVEQPMAYDQVSTIEKNIDNQNKISVDAQKLLLEVEGEIQLNKIQKNQSIAKNESKIKIDPTLLLDETEHEMNQTFKEKAVEKINQQFKNIKEAFAKKDN
jgi:hypothetical protein